MNIKKNILIYFVTFCWYHYKWMCLIYYEKHDIVLSYLLQSCKWHITVVICFYWSEYLQYLVLHHFEHSSTCRHREVYIATLSFYNTIISNAVANNLSLNVDNGRMWSMTTKIHGNINRRQLISNEQGLRFVLYNLFVNVYSVSHWTLNVCRIFKLIMFFVTIYIYMDGKVYINYPRPNYWEFF